MDQQNLPVLAKKIWQIVRVAFFMLRKGISKRKFMLDLNMILKRGKIASKTAIANLMIFHHNNHHHHHNRHHVSSFPVPSGSTTEYEFSCSNTPSYVLPFGLNKRIRNNNHKFFGCAHATPTLDDGVENLKVALEMLTMNSTNEMAVQASPALPGFGRSPAVRQLRITDSPYPLKEVDDVDSGFVDKAAEEFIERFYKELKKQNNLNA